MIPLQTRVNIPRANFSIQHDSKIFLMGSCFTEHIAKQLQRGGFQIHANPFGTLYNPLSIHRSIERLLNNKDYQANELFEANGLIHSYDFHSFYSSTSLDSCLEAMNHSLHRGANALNEADYLIFTWGSAYVYYHQSSVVGNCHKLPENSFTRQLSSVQELINNWKGLLKQLLNKKPHRKIILSVSPIRHLRDGAHGNQLSKATLQLFCEELRKLYPEQITYFPAYEILLDELRDYRFYAEDMTHPAPLAIKIIGQRWRESFLDSQAIDLMDRCSKLYDELQHRPLQAESPASKSRLLRLQEKLDELKRAYPYIDLEQTCTASER